MPKALAKEIGHQIRWALPIWLLWLFTTWWPNNRVTIKLRGTLYRPFFKKCGKNFQIASGVQILNPHEIEIGDNVYIAYYAWLNGLGGIIIDDEVVLGPYVTISSLNHAYKNGSFRFGGATAGAVHIGKGCWLAAHVSVIAGVSIGSGCLIAANAVVTVDIPTGMIAGGVPARVIGECREQESDLVSRSGFSSGA